MSDSSNEEIAVGNGITLDSGDSDTEVYSNSMFSVCLFDLAAIFMPQNFVVYWSTNNLIHQGSVSAIMTQTQFFLNMEVLSFG